MTDTQRLDWLENEGWGGAIISDDDGHWAYSCEGFQNVPMETPADIETHFFIPKAKWRDTIREAIDDAIKDGKD